jgi:CBS domain-containing protein
MSMSRLTVRDLMTAEVFVVSPDDSLSAARDLMSRRHIRHVPVVADDGSVAGLVSERDLLRRAFSSDADLPLSLQEDLLSAVKVSDVMTWEVETIEADADLASAAQLMLDNKYGCLPVVEQGVLTGILTEADFVRFVAALPEAAGRPDRPRTVRRVSG